ncbi:MAG TPA: transglutaminase family protein [Candidatus Kryptonia bacterium]|nr:transglutaminase family protein [Candidatus Kryptonia bacterium]
MRFTITHSTRYRYARPAWLEPHVIRVRPRSDGAQSLRDFRVRVQPRPVGWAECLDLDGNAAAKAWFDGLTAMLTVSTTCTVETRRTNPFDFLLEPWAAIVPLQPTGELERALAPYRHRSHPDDSVTAFAASVLRDADNQTVSFLSTLVRRIAERCRPMVRLEGDPLPPRVTLSEGAGACRDLAVLFIDACRAVGLPARFVSGYYGGPIEAERRYLHAWAEVFLPGAGWRGFDPLQGLAVADRHIAVAAAAHFSAAAPISGTLRGGSSTTTLDVDLHIEVLDDGEAR